jgi:hypothetical protein
MLPNAYCILSCVLSAVFASCLVKAMLHFLGAVQNEVFRHCPRWHYLAALILTHLSNDSSLPHHGPSGSNNNDDSLVTITMASSITAACAIESAGNLELLAHFLADTL